MRISWHWGPTVSDPEAPPILKHWRNLYALVLVNLLLCILLFYAFGRVFS